MENSTLFDSLVNTTYHADDYKNYSVIEDYAQGGNNKSMTYEAMCIVVTYSVFCLLGTIGNGLVIWFGIFRMKKTVNVVFFLSLAVADFSFAFFLPFQITQLVLEYWPFEKFICKLIHWLMDLNMLVSIFQLTVISVDRCICVVFPVWCHNHRRPRLAFIIVMIIWIISFLLAFFYLFAFDLSDISTKCSSTLYESSLITVLEFVLFFLLPFVIIAFCYIVIVLHLRKKCIFKFPKLFKTIVAVIIAFFVCWFPSHLFSLLFMFEKSNLNISAFYYGSLIALVLVIMNSCINPILYVFIGHDFKDKFFGSFRVILEKAFTEEDMSDSKKHERHVALPRLTQEYEEEDAVA